MVARTSVSSIDNLPDISPKVTADQVIRRTVEGVAL